MLLEFLKLSARGKGAPGTPNEKFRKVFDFQNAVTFITKVQVHTHNK